MNSTPSTKFSIPGTDLYLCTDGSLSPIVEPGERVLELTSEYAEMLEKAYPGQIIQNLRFLSGGSGGGVHSGDKDPTTYHTVELMKLVPYLGEGVKGVEILGAWIEGGIPDPIMESLQNLHRELRQTLRDIQDFALAAWVSAREDNLAFLTAHSSSALQTANAFLQSKASTSDPVWASRIALAERDSLIAVQTFAGDIERGYWMRPYSVAAISWAGNPTDYYTGWMPHIPDRAEVNQFNQVWDHRWALPALLYAITVRIVVLKAFRTGFPTEEEKQDRAEIKKYLELLGAVYTKMWSGIRAPEHFSDLTRAEWPSRGRHFVVAVDIYGGYYIQWLFWNSRYGWRKDAFPPGLAPAGELIGPASLEQAEQHQKWIARHWWNLVYLRIGLDDLLLYISELDNIYRKRWFSNTYTKVQSNILKVREFSRAYTRVQSDVLKVRDVIGSYEAREAAFAAASLSHFAQADDAAASAVLTHSLYEALRTGGDRAQEIVATCVRDLSQLDPIASDDISAEAVSPRLLDQVEQGESVTISRDGKPVARLIPVSGSSREERRRANAELKHCAQARP
jgi:prevent-host-death family protein